MIENSQRRYAPLSAAPDYASDLGTEFDSFVVQNSQRRYAPLAPAPNYSSDLGTEFDPFVIENSRPRYTGSGGQSAIDDGRLCHTPASFCDR